MSVVALALVVGRSAVSRPRGVESVPDVGLAAVVVALGDRETPTPNPVSKRSPSPQSYPESGTETTSDALPYLDLVRYT